MKITSATTRPAVPSGPMIGPSHANPGKPAAGAAATSTRCGVRPSRRIDLAEVGLDLLDRLLQLLDRAALAGAAHVGDLRQDVDAVARQVGGEVSICRASPQPARPSTTNTSVTTTSTAGTRPSQRSSQVTGGARTNDSRMASAIGTSTACAQ